MTTTTPTTPPASLHAKLAAVTAALQPVTRDGSHAQGFSYVTEGAVFAAVRAELAKQRVQVYPSFHIEDVRDTGQETDKGAPILLVTVAGTLTFACGDTGETVDVQMVDQAQDATGGAATKAKTGALKSALVKTFLLPTAEDPDHAPTRAGNAAGSASNDPRTIDVKFGKHRGKQLGTLTTDELAEVHAEATGQWMRDKVAAVLTMNRTEPTPPTSAPTPTTLQASAAAEARA